MKCLGDSFQRLSIHSQRVRLQAYGLLLLTISLLGSWCADLKLGLHCTCISAAVHSPNALPRQARPALHGAKQ